MQDKNKKNKKRSLWLSLLTTTSLVATVAVPAVVLASCADNTTGGDQGGNNNGGNNGGNGGDQGGNNNGGDNQGGNGGQTPKPETPVEVSIKDAVEVVGSIDALLKMEGGKPTGPNTMQDVWNQQIKTHKAKFFDKELTADQLATLDLAVEYKNEGVVGPWTPAPQEGQQQSTYAKYADWSKKIDIEITYLGSIKHEGHQFDINSLGDLKAKLNAYTSENQKDKKGLEAILLDSGYVQPVPASGTTLSYELAESELNLTDNKELLEIHILEKSKTSAQNSTANVIKDLKLNLPVSDLNITNKFSVKVTDKKTDDKLTVKEETKDSSLTFHVGIDPTSESTWTTLYVQDPSITNDETLKVFDLSKVTAKDALIDAGFVNETATTPPPQPTADGNATTKEETVTENLNSDKISAATNIYNVNWKSATAKITETTTTPEQDGKATGGGDTNTQTPQKQYNVEISFVGEPIEGHEWDDGSIGEKNIHLGTQPLVMQKQLPMTGKMIKEHTTYLNMTDANTNNQNNFLNWWKNTAINLQQADSALNNIIKQEIGANYWKDINLTNQSNMSITLDANKHPVITHTYLWYKNTYWAPNQLNKVQSNDSQKFVITFNNVTIG